MDIEQLSERARKEIDDERERQMVVALKVAHRRIAQAEDELEQARHALDQLKLDMAEGRWFPTGLTIMEKRLGLGLPQQRPLVDP